MKWTEQVIQKALVDRRYGPVPFTRYICVPNVCSTAAVMTGEADLIAVSEAGFVKEFEIKVSFADLRRDKAKDRHKFWDHPKNKVSELWYVMPLEELEVTDWPEHIPSYAGMMAVSPDCRGHKRFHVLREADKRQEAGKLTPEQMLRVARLGCIRYWSTKEGRQE